MSHSVTDMLVAAEKEKKKKYLTDAEAHHASFSPFVVIVDGALGHDAVLFLHCLAERLSSRWDKRFGKVFGWNKAQLSFAMIRATDLCLRGSCVSWRSGTGIDGEAGFPVVKFVYCDYV